MNSLHRWRRTAAFTVGTILVLGLAAIVSMWTQSVTTRDVRAIRAQIATLRSLADNTRAVLTTDLALRIRRLPVGPERLAVALSLANLSTEGDFGRDTLQQVTTTLETTLRESPSAGVAGKSESSGRAYDELAQLARYEQMTVALDSPRYQEALAALDRLDALRAGADFTLTDLDGRTWTRSALKGQVVLVNFWATWCPPCRKEMPDLDALYHQFRGQGLAILAISDEPADTVRAFLTQHPVSYPILLDVGRSVSDPLKIDSIPKTFIYDRTGHLVAQSIDMRTRPQFLALLARAGIK